MLKLSAKLESLTEATLSWSGEDASSPVVIEKKNETEWAPARIVHSYRREATVETNGPGSATYFRISNGNEVATACVQAPHDDFFIVKCWIDSNQIDHSVKLNEALTYTAEIKSAFTGNSLKKSDVLGISSNLYFLSYNQKSSSVWVPVEHRQNLIISLDCYYPEPVLRPETSSQISFGWIPYYGYFPKQGNYVTQVKFKRAAGNSVIANFRQRVF